MPSLDRLSRSLQDLITLVAQLRRRGIGFRSLHENLDTTTPVRGRPRPTNDSWIAACCLVRELPLATLNIKDFADVEQHEGP